MRAMAVTTYGEPLTSVDVAEPDVPAGNALVEVVACGVCFSDVKTARGLMPYSAGLALPHVPGHEIAGRVIETNPPGLVPLGSLVTVFHYWPCGTCAACRRGDETLCSQLVAWVGFTHWGGFRERLAVPVERLIMVPQGIDPVQAAPMTCALGTAYRAVVTRGGVTAGSRVAVLGLGGVGIHAAQIAAAAGGDVLGFDVHEPTLAMASDLGIAAFRSDDEDVLVELLADTDAEGLDVVVDTVGTESTLQLADRLVREGGRIVGVGYSPMTALVIPTPRFVLGELELVGSRYAHRDDLDHAIQLVAAGHVRSVVGLVAPLEEVNDVFEALDRGEVIGRAVLTVATTEPHGTHPEG